MEVPVRIGRIQSLHEHFQIPTPHGLATKALFDGVRGCVFSVHLQQQPASPGAKTPAPLSHLVFRNFYTATLRLVQVNRDGMSTVLLEEYPLMQHIHYEDDAQNWHVLPLDKVPMDMSAFESLCVYLFQPSPLWDNAAQGDNELTKRPSRLALIACIEAKDVQESATQCLTLVSRLRHLLHASHQP